MDDEGVLVGNDNDSDFELVEHNELPPEMKNRRSTRGRKSSSKKGTQSQSRQSNKSQSKKKNVVSSSGAAENINDEEHPVNYEILQ